MEHYIKKIKSQQDKLIDQGCIPFICKQMANTQDSDIQDECMLTCIALIIGGNEYAQ